MAVIEATIPQAGKNGQLSAVKALSTLVILMTSNAHVIGPIGAYAPVRSRAICPKITLVTQAEYNSL